MRHRGMTAVIVALGHVVVVMLIWVSRAPTERKNIAQDVGTIFLFSTSGSERRPDERIGRPTLEPPSPTPPQVDVSQLLQSILPSVATLPPLPESSAPSGVGWRNAITDEASDMIERARIEAARPMNRPPRSPDLSPLHEKPHTLEWITRHAHEVIDAHGVPQWVLVQPCESEFLVQKSDCTVERVLPHGILFEFMTEQHDAAMQYGGPNAIP
jgi:hypothetical protein